MLRRRHYGLSTLLLTTLGVLAGCVPVESTGPENEEDLGEEDVGTGEQELVGGTAAVNAPGAVGTLSNCTAALVDPRFVLTAGHCLPGTGPYTDNFSYANTSASRSTQYAHMLWNPDITKTGYEHDLAILRLAQPALAATPALIAPGLPANGTACTKYGAGCQDRTTLAGAGPLQQIGFNWPTSYANCPGDSGGPAICNGQIAGVNSAYSQPSGLDVTAHAYQAIAILNAARTLGSPTVHNPVTGSFSYAASQPGAKVVAGQFNWGNGDVAVVGGSGPNGIIVAESTAPYPQGAIGWSASGWPITNAAEVAFGTWATQARGAVAGDFDGDGQDDIALYGGPGWVTIPIAFSNGNGTFTVTNHYQAGDMAHWWNHPQAKIAAGDVDADGDADLIISGVPGWGNLPVGLSARDGTFVPVANPAGSFPEWATTSGATLLAGDFNGDGAADVALSGPVGWTTIPVAYSQFNGTWTVENHDVSYFPGWVSAPGVRFTVGDFDGDGDDDIGTSGGQGWVTALFALSSRHGFQAANMPAPDFPLWASVSTLMSGDFDSDGRDELAVAGGPGWSSVPVLTTALGVPWIRTGEYLTGTFSSSDPQLDGRYVDDYYYTADTASAVQVALTRSTSSSVDTLLRVIDTTTWTVVAENDDAPGMYLDSRVSFTPVRGRTYVLRATTYGAGATGEHHIMVGSGVLVPGGSYAGSLTPEDGKAPYHPRKFADHLILVPASSGNVTVNLSAAFDAYLEVRYSKTGFLVASNDDCQPGNYNTSCVTFSALDHSPLIIKVTSYSQLVTGAYTVTVN